MIQIHQVIEYLREKLPSMRVDGAAELASAKDDSRLMNENGQFIPTVFAMLGTFTTVTNSDQPLDQDYDERLVIIACINNQTDRTGKNAQQFVYQLRFALLRVLLNYGGFDTDAHYMQYHQDYMSDMDRSRYWHRFEFKIKGKLSIEDGVELDLDVFNKYVGDWNSTNEDADQPMATDILEPLYYIPD